MIIQFYKKIGETPLECIKRFKLENDEFSKSKISYAGRLDPLAHGILILLLDDSCKLQNSIHQISKVYRFKLMFGASTDTYDVLGMITSTTNNFKVSLEEVNKILYNFKTNYNQKYPPYSSYRINGKPLWKWTKEGNYDKVSHLIEEKKREINNYKINKLEYVFGNDIYKIVCKNVNSLSEIEKKNFRVNEILKSWERFFKDNDFKYPIFEIVADVSTGTFIRSICNDIGKKLGISSNAFEIDRIKVNFS